MAQQESSEQTEKKTVFDSSSFKNASKILRFILPYKWSFFFAMLLLSISSLMFMVFVRVPGEMMDIANNESTHGYTLRDMGLFLFFILLFQGVVSYIRVLLLAQVSELSLADIRNALYGKLLTMPLPFFEKNRVGELVGRISGDVEKLYSTFSITLAEFIRQALILVAGIIYLIVVTPRLSLIMIATFPIVILAAMFFGRYLRGVSKQRQKELAETNNIVQETMQAIQAVKAFTNEWYESARYGKINQDVIKTSLKLANIRSLFAAFIILVLFGALFFILFQGASMVQNKTMTSGELTTFITLTAVIGGAIASLGSFYTEILSAVGATERIIEILEHEHELEIRPPASTKRPEGNIVYKDVVFHYPTRPDINVLNGISLEVKAGQKIALVGSSGAGKSTIVQLLLRFYDVEKGNILLDNKNIYDWNITDYRSHIAFVPQEVLLFGGTIRENIGYGKPNSNDAEIIEAAQKAHAWDFIQSFPEGLDTLVGERGIKLSGGQRQRIAIARAILKNPSILILDEATSALDAESEKIVQEALNTLMKGRTSIIVAHRLATIREVDCIYVLDNGKVVEKGTHEELYHIENGIYAHLARLQFENNKENIFHN